MIVIIPCGAKKGATAAPARELYLGGYFRSLLAWALSVAPAADIRIISAKHGFVRLDDVLEPYNVRFGMSGDVSIDVLRGQAAAQGLAGDVWVIGGVDYALRVKQAIPGARSVFEEARAEMPDGMGIGYQRQWAAQNAGRVPGTKKRPG